MGDNWVKKMSCVCPQCVLSVSVCVWVCLDGVWASLDNVFWSSEVISNEKTSMFVTMFSCTIFSQWPHKGPNCQNSENLKSPKVIFFFGARHHVIWSFWSQIYQFITMWTPTCQFQPCILPPPSTLSTGFHQKLLWRLFKWRRVSKPWRMLLLPPCLVAS